MQDQLLRFGPFELDPVAEELRRAGLVLRMPRQPFRILLLLVQRAGEVVTRDDIHAAIWDGDTYVDFEHGINSAIRQIRFVLGDHAETPRYIRTLPRRGYSFIAAVEHVARPSDSPMEPEPKPEPIVTPPPPRAPLRRLISAFAAATVIAILATAAVWLARSGLADRPRSREVAVMPFRRLGPPIGGLDERSFAEELRVTIGKLPRAHVSLVGAGAQARADVVINGTIRQSADGVRVVVSIADAASQTQLWSETFQRPPARPEGMDVEIAHRVMAEVARRFLPAPQRDPPLVTRAAPSAVGLYQRARLLHARSQAYDWMRTKEAYAAAVREEPRLAEAWSGMANVWVVQALSGPSDERERAARQAADCARRAVALQPRNAEAHMVLGLLAAQRDFDLAGAEDALRRAVAADPAFVEAHLNLALVLGMRGEADESLRELAIAQQLDPILLDLSAVEPLLYLHARRYEDARARYRDILAVRPDSQQARWGLMFTFVAQQNWSEAIAIVRTAPSVPQVPDVPNTRAGFLKVYAALEPQVRSSHQHGSMTDYFAALYYAQLGDRDRAFELLDHAVETRVPALSYMLVDPRVDPLRSDPRFKLLLARMNFARPPEGQLASR